jgi:Domain of unknown function (DUF4145)
VPTKRDIWKLKYHEDSLPPWPCPLDCNGTLAAVGEPLLMEETKRSQSLRDDDDWDPTWIEELHVQRLACSTCATIAVLVSLARPEETESIEPDGYPSYTYTRRLRPVSLTPMPQLIPIPRECPGPVTEVLSEAFSLLWISPPAALARMRAAIELMMDERKIPRKARNMKKDGTWGKYYDLNLHKRILRFAQRFPESGEFLLAAKWLGNEGAHASASFPDVLTAADLIDEVLGDLYGKRREQLRKQASQINKKRGSIQQRS